MNQNPMAPEQLTTEVPERLESFVANFNKNFDFFLKRFGADAELGESTDWYIEAISFVPKKSSIRVDLKPVLGNPEDFGARHPSSKHLLGLPYQDLSDDDKKFIKDFIKSKYSKAGFVVTPQIRLSHAILNKVRSGDEGAWEIFLDKHRKNFLQNARNLLIKERLDPNRASFYVDQAIEHIKEISIKDGLKKKQHPQSLINRNIHTFIERHIIKLENKAHSYFPEKIVLNRKPLSRAIPAPEQEDTSLQDALKEIWPELLQQTSAILEKHRNPKELAVFKMIYNHIEAPLPNEEKFQYLTNREIGRSFVPPISSAAAGVIKTKINKAMTKAANILAANNPENDSFQIAADYLNYRNNVRER